MKFRFPIVFKFHNNTKGTNFGTGSPLVYDVSGTFDGSSRTVSWQSSSLLDMSIPAGIGSSHPVIVSIDGQSSASYSFSYSSTFLLLKFLMYISTHNFFFNGSPNNWRKCCDYGS